MNSSTSLTRSSLAVGIVILTDEDPELPEDVVKIERLTLGEEEAPMPEPFVWDPNDI